MEGESVASREFTVADEYVYNRAGPVRWIISHVLRYKRFLLGAVGAMIAANVLLAAIPRLTGTAFNEVLRAHPDQSRLALVALAILACVLAGGVFDAAARFSTEILAQRLERDSRDELYLSLLGKSQTFHNRQQVGDIMARATNDVRQLNPMINPGVSLILDSTSALVIPIIFIGFIHWQLLLAPLIFTVFYIIAVRNYTRRLTPVTADMRQQFGVMNAGLEETITGIEVVKSTGQEAQERRKFNQNASQYRDYYVKNGEIQARYLPLLLIAIAIVGGFLQALLLLSQGQITLGQLIAFMGLMALLRYPSFISIFTFSLVQLGIAGANRILTVMREETDLDQNIAGYSAEMRGDVSFQNVSFAYDAGGEAGSPWALRDVTLHVAAGQTIAIVGQTGAGKTTLTKLVNRTYDATEGRVLVDGVDVRNWSLDSLRSQIGAIEQDIFLFSRSIAEGERRSRDQPSPRRRTASTRPAVAAPAAHARRPPPAPAR